MEHHFLLIPPDILNKQAALSIIRCNEKTQEHGLMLTQPEAEELAKTRFEALSSTGRIEFGGGTIEKIITVFCDSPFLTKYNYTQILNELIETFYYFKNETMDALSDDELLMLMKRYFDDNCRGSIELLQNRELEKLAHNIRFGISEYASICAEDEALFEGEEDDEQS